MDENTLPEMSFGRRIRDFPETIFPSALLPPAAIALIALACLIGTGSQPFEVRVIPSVVFSVVIFVVTALVSVPLFHVVANEAAQNREKQRKKELSERHKEVNQFDHLKRDIRLPLLEWAVKHDRVTEIDGLDERIALAVELHYRNQQDNAPPVPYVSSL